MPRKSQTGFTLIGTMIAQVVLAITLMAFVRMLDFGSKSSRGIASKIDAEQMRALAAQVLSKQDICTQVFQGKHFTAFPSTTTMTQNPPKSSSIVLNDITLKDVNSKGNNVTIAAAGQRFDGNATLESISLSNFQAITTEGTYIADLLFHISSPNLTGVKAYNSRIPIMLETSGTDTDRQITGCGDQQEDPANGGFACGNIIGGSVDLTTGNCRVLLENRTSDPATSELQTGQIWLRTDL